MLNLYRYSLFPFCALSDIILKIAGNKFIPKGYNIDIAKLIKVSLIKAIAVLIYITQKQEIKNQ